jgi:hypothetical protein
MLAINARLVHPVQQAAPVPMANREKQANQASQAKITVQAAIVATKTPIQIPDPQVKVHPDPLVQPVPPEIKALQVQLVAQEKEADKAPLALPDPLVQPEETANQDRKAHLATMLPEAEAKKDPKDHPVQSVNPDPKDQTATQPLAAAAQANPDQLDHPAREVRTEIQENKARKVPLAIPAQMPNIVLAHHEAAWSIVVALSLFFAISTKKKSQTISNGRKREEN